MPAPCCGRCAAGACARSTLSHTAFNQQNNLQLVAGSPGQEEVAQPPFTPRPWQRVCGTPCVRSSSITGHNNSTSGAQRARCVPLPHRHIFKSCLPCPRPERCSSGRETGVLHSADRRTRVRQHQLLAARAPPFPNLSSLPRLQEPPPCTERQTQTASMPAELLSIAELFRGEVERGRRLLAESAEFRGSSDLQVPAPLASSPCQHRPKRGSCMCGGVSHRQGGRRRVPRLDAPLPACLPAAVCGGRRPDGPEARHFR